MPSLDNFQAENTYTTLGTLRFEPVEQVTVIVTNAAIFAQFAIADPPGLRAAAYDWETLERRMLMASWVWGRSDFRGREIVGVRVRKAVTTGTGTPPIVTIHA